jgi:hypothetical protein
MSDHDSFAERGRALEEEYFRKKDRELIEKLRRATAVDQARGELSRETGLTDPALLADLEELGLRPDTVSLLPLIPVVEIAWAEGGITPAERQLVLSLARSRGVTEGSAADLRLNSWMDSRPSPQQFAKATRIMSALLDSGAPVAKDLTADQLVKYCEQLASASGGLFGLPFRAISMEERTLLTRIASDLKGPKK